MIGAGSKASNTLKVSGKEGNPFMVASNKGGDSENMMKVGSETDI